MNLLARREHTELEIRRKLLLKGYPEADIDAVIPKLASQGLISNQRFAENYTHHRRQKGYGPQRIRLELQARGVAEDLIEHTVDITDNAWFACAYKAWQKRFKSIKPTDFKTRAAQMRFLQYRGFTEEQIANIFHSDIEHA